MNLYEIEKAYLQGNELSAINELYKPIIAEATEAQQIEIWQQVCTFANAAMIGYLIEQGWRAATVEDRSGNTPLHFLAEPKHTYNYFVTEQNMYECTKLLLSAKVSILRKNSYQETALMLGAKQGYVGMLQAYSEAGSKIDFTDRDGNNLLHIIAQYSSHASSTLESTKERLINYQSRPDFAPDNERMAQEQAALQWQFNVAKERFDQFISFAFMALEMGIDPLQKNNQKETAVDVAIYYKSKIIGAILNGLDSPDEEVVKLYFKAGGMNVYQACITKDLEALQALIQIGADLDAAYDKNEDRFDQMTPLAIAMVQHSAETTDLLLKNGADASLLDSKGWHPFRYLYIPISNINTNFEQFKDKTFQRILKAYFDAGFSIDNILDDQENTLLTLSAKHADGLMLCNNDSVAKTLIDEAIYSNANVNQTNRDGVSALMYLCLTDGDRGERNLITLLEQGASTELIDKNGKTALMYAANNSKHTVAKTYCELLAEFGNVMLNAKDNEEKTALDYAVEKNNEALVAWLVERM
ncbi:ankyrin repeat domain-containing protein [Pedobacter sp. SL55]|uniref:ankyrin repeat domain-containing protein n=1 Tax=Pedobacter sp. SL55 TaxID=2995161 RepID=UPI00227184C7|nr:ankyrin repeat domain-containing protein [Pedobacter sp. SL55]WAC39438.1 ankyrin repeat domain-containing protein [Pedobacter sp. SL55]